MNDEKELLDRIEWAEECSNHIKNYIEEQGKSHKYKRDDCHILDGMNFCISEDEDGGKEAIVIFCSTKSKELFECFKKKSMPKIHSFQVGMDEETIKRTINYLSNVLDKLKFYKSKD